MSDHNVGFVKSISIESHSTSSRDDYKWTSGDMGMYSGH